MPKITPRAEIRSWIIVSGTTGAILVGGLIAGPISSGWRSPSHELFSGCAVTAPIFALALFLEIAVVMVPVIAEQGLSETNRAVVRTLIRLNATMLVMSESCAMYAVGTQRSTAFLLVCSVAPWAVQLTLLVDTAYLKVGLNRIGRAKS